MDIKFALKFGKTKLEKLENPLLETEVLLQEACHHDRVFFRMYPEFKLKNTEFEKFKKFIELRKNNTPVAQIIGYKIWNNFKIIVDENVLIPRDETEILCQEIIKSWKKNYLESREILNNSENKSQKNINYPARILDIGTGSGIISLFLKNIFPKSTVLGIDISEKALKIAQQNAKNLSLNPIFKKSDLLEIFENETFELIIANLPYVPEDLIITKEVKKEPSLAIFSGKDGLDLIRKLKTQLIERNINFTELWLEFLPSQAESIRKIFKEFHVEFLSAIDSREIFFAKITQN